MAGRTEAGATADRLVAEVLAACRLSRREAALRLWEFGGQKLKRTAGDVEHLERLLGNDLFSPLSGFERVETGLLEQIDDSARLIVTAFSGNGEAASFLFSLKRSAAGGRTGNWQITGLERQW